MNLNIFNTTNLFDAATDLFQQLGIQIKSLTTEPVPVKEILDQHYKDNDAFRAIKNAYFIGLIQDSVFQTTGLFDPGVSYKQGREEADKNYDGLMLFALELKKQPTRAEISDLTRSFNRISKKMPVGLVLKYNVNNEAVISIALSERFKYLQKWRQGEKPGKVIILRDVHTEQTHAGHLRILRDLSIPEHVTNFAQLHQHWLQVLDVSILNKKFFQELSNWYFAALNEVSFPDDVEKNEEIRNATNLIRLITRVIFIWFIKEKSLVPASLFNKDFVASILKDFNKTKKSDNYYKAILQNLFFGTLNQKMDVRKFAKDGKFHTKKAEFDVKNLYRYANLFNISEKEAVKLFEDIPFLNGGLFDCLDREKVYVDGFSRNSKKQPSVPDRIFFGEEREVDLNRVYGTSNKQYKTRGLINLLESYKFTVAENTPLEEEIALDPELLGKVFENLLASYNPETQTTARKQTGSFYTPREIVDYMVDESLFEYIKQNVKNKSTDFDSRLRNLFSYDNEGNPFNSEETDELIEAINNAKILDPACGSGAFPMGVLHKMVHLLQKLDPGNVKWKAQQKEKIIGNKIKELEKDKKAIAGLNDRAVREKAIQAVDERLKEIDEIFESENNFDDYARKLYLIENCIYGIDIQPIAVQIAKLRFFISLVIDQKADKSKENFGVRSLPNLESKFVAANTLIGLDKPQQLSFRNPKIDEKENELKELRHKYFAANTRKEKLALQRKDKDLRKEIAALLKADGWQSTVAEQIASFDPYDQNTFANWFDPEWMFGITAGFDIVIGNPPYVQLQKAINGKQKLADLYKAQNFKTFERTGDIYCLFYEKGLNLLKRNGVLCYITSNKWMRAGYGEKLREFFTKYNPQVLIDLGPGVFESATVDTNILILQNAQNQNKLKAVTIHEAKKDGINLSEFAEQNSVVLNKLGKDAWFIGSAAEQRLKEKIERIGKPLKEWDVNIYYGIKTGLNEAFIITTEKRNEILANCQTKEERKRTEAIIKPILRGRDIKRYYYDWAGLWVILAKFGFYKEAHLYPSIVEHLKSYEKELKARGQCRYTRQGKGINKDYPGQHHWLELDNNPQDSYLSEFEKEKVIWKRIGSLIRFALDADNTYPLDSNVIMTGKNLKYICGFLNSKLSIRRLLENSPKTGTGDVIISVQALEPHKIPPITPSNEPIVQQIEALVDKILAAKKEDKNADTTAWEREIDGLVYKLYELKEEEIGIVEKNKK
jgi:hypothetical protein